MSPHEHRISEVSDLSDVDAIMNVVEDVAEPHRNVKSSDPRSCTPFIPHHDKEKGSGFDTIFAGSLERQPWAVCLLFLYAIIAVPSWTIICWLSYRPIGISAYDDTHNALFTSFADWNHSDRCRRAANVGLSIIAAVGIPVTSAICAKATVIYCQMKSNGKPPSLTMRQTLALADKGWSDLGVIWDLIHPTGRRRTRSPLLLFSVFLVGLALLLPVLQSTYVVTSHVQILTATPNEQALGYAMDPASIIFKDMTSVLNDVTSTAIDGSLYDKNPYLWPVDGGNVSVMSPQVRDGSTGPGPQGLFTASFPVGTDTGLFRQNVLRLNHSIHCENLSQTDYPSICPGNTSFNRTYTNIDISNLNPFSDQTSRRYRVRICVPGDTAASPWKSTNNRQDITEEFYLDSQTTDNSRLINNANTTFTQHCSTSTSMGYFELPNYYNNHTAGDLLAELPPAATMSSWGDLESRDADNPRSLGPLTLSVMAIFGDGSFFNKTGSQNNYTDQDSILVCEQLHQPFSRLQLPDPLLNPIQLTPQCTPTSMDTTGSPYATALVNALFDWLPIFSNTSNAETAFNLTIYSAHKSLLTAETLAEVDEGNPVFMKPGYDIQKPEIPLPALIVISALLATQILCLAGLALYASWYHTWTNSLDTFALLRMGASLGQQELPLISNVKASAMLSLDEREGWIGASVPAGQQDDTSPGVLAIGGRHRMERNRLYRNVLNDGRWLYEKAKVPVVIRSLVRFLSPEKQQGDEPKKFVKVGWEYRRVGRTVADV